MCEQELTAGLLISELLQGVAHALACAETEFSRPSGTESYDRATTAREIGYSAGQHFQGPQSAELGDLRYSPRARQATCLPRLRSSQLQSPFQ